MSKRSQTVLVVVGASIAVVVASVLVAFHFAQAERDIFELYKKAEDKGDGFSHFLYKHESEHFKGQGTVAKIGSWSETLWNVTVKADSGQEIMFVWERPEDYYKRPEPFKVGDRISFRCKIIDLKTIGPIPKFISEPSKL